MRKFFILLFLFFYASLFGQINAFVSIKSHLLTKEKNTKGQTENLAVLGEVWGFLKYYHPNVARGDFDWDQELFDKIPLINATASAAERNQILAAWIDDLGFFETDESRLIPPQIGDVKLEPDLDWIENVDALGEVLSGKLIDIKNAIRTGKNVYVGLDTYVFRPVFSEKNNVNTSSVNSRLLSLFRYWNMVQYFFPNRHLIEENWHDVLREVVPEFVAAETLLDYRLAVLKVIARIHDTHANIWSERTDIDRFLYGGTYYAPMRLGFVEGKVVVTGYYKEEQGITSGLKPGDVIVSVDGEQMDEKIKRILPYIPASNYTTKLRDLIPNLLRSDKKDSLHIEFERNGVLFSKKVKLYTSVVLGVNKDPNANKLSYQLLDDCVGYVYPGTLKEGEVPLFMNAFENTEGIIIDFRCYPSNFIPFSLGEYLMPNPTPFVIFTSGNIETPGLFTFVDSYKVGKNNPNYYKGKIVIIVNTETQSQAEYTAMALRVAPNAIVIGDTTSGADGDISRITLPGNISTFFSGIGVLYPDGRETQRIGLVPDITVRPTIKGIAEGRDELLEEAIIMICDGPIEGITPIENNENIKIYPVPSNDVLHVEGDYSGEAHIFDCFGHAVKHFAFNGKKEVDTKDLAPGIYVLILKTNEKGELVNKKFIVTR